ncbi:MAG: CRISPR-associated protein Csx3 [Candidatus Saccharicenans sp.]
MRIEIDVSSLYDETAKIKDLDLYLKKVREMAGEGNEVVLQGRGPVWLYLKIAHELHGHARRLVYHSPVIGELIIFDHDPY